MNICGNVWEAMVMSWLKLNIGLDIEVDDSSEKILLAQKRAMICAGENREFGSVEVIRSANGY